MFLRLGLTAFGGPAAHIAMMREDVVRRRRWMSDQHFLDLLGATHLIPGPNSTEMAIHIGYARAGWPGLIVGGVCFIVPAMVLVLPVPWAAGLLDGTNVAAVALMAGVTWQLGRAAIVDWLTVALAVLSAILLFRFRVNSGWLVAGGAVAGAAAVLL